MTYEQRTITYAIIVAIVASVAGIGGYVLSLPPPEEVSTSRIITSEGIREYYSSDESVVFVKLTSYDIDKIPNVIEKFRDRGYELKDLEYALGEVWLLFEKPILHGYEE